MARGDKTQQKWQPCVRFVWMVCDPVCSRGSLAGHITCCLTVQRAAWDSIGGAVCLDCVNNTPFSRCGRCAPIGTQTSLSSTDVSPAVYQTKSLLACSTLVYSIQIDWKESKFTGRHKNKWANKPYSATIFTVSFIKGLSHVPLSSARVHGCAELAEGESILPEYTLYLDSSTSIRISCFFPI